MKRWLLILIVVGVVVVLAAGVTWYVYRNTGAKLMARAEVAMQAKQFDRSVELANAAIAKDPKNWRGYYIRSMAYTNLQRFDDARESLKEAALHDPPGVTVELAMAETYAAPGRRTLASMESRRNPKAMEAAIGQIKDANKELAKYLADVKDKDGKDALDILQAVAQNLVQIGSAQKDISVRLEEEATVEETAKNDVKRDALRKGSQESAAQSAKTLAEAGRGLLDVVKRDPKRDVAARLLVDPDLHLLSPALLPAAHKAILEVDDPPPQAASALILQDLDPRESSAKGDTTKDLAAAAGKLDEITAKHPKELDVKLARAEVALRQADWVRTHSMCKEVLDAKPDSSQQLGAHLIEARAFRAEGKKADAERELGRLATQAPKSIGIQYTYAQAAADLGKKEAAREAMRAVTLLTPRNPDEKRYVAFAHGELARSLEKDGLVAEAFPDARAYYDNNPDDPDALFLFVKAAGARKQEALAEEAILTTLKKCDPYLHDLLKALPKGAVLEPAQVQGLKGTPTRPEVLLAVGAAYDALGQGAKAAAARQRAAECKATAVEDILTVAEAMIAGKRVAEAEKILADGREKDPKDPRLAAALAGLYSITGRYLQAVEAYRVAVKLDPRNIPLRLGLARGLVAAGLLDESMAECQAILGTDPANDAALHLASQIQFAQGKITMDEMLRQEGSAAPKGLALARTYRASGELQKCVDVCLEELGKTPGSIEARAALAQAYVDLGQTDKAVAQWTAVLKDRPALDLPYRQIAELLARTQKPEAAAKALAAIPGAKPEKVEMALAWLQEREGLFDAGAETLAKIVANKEVAAETRTQARMLRAQSLARGGHTDQAIAEFDEMARDQAWHGTALFAKSQALQAADRGREAEAVLDKLMAQAAKDGNDAQLQRLVQEYVEIKQIDKALAACDRLDLDPLLRNDPRPLLIRAGVLASAGRLTEAANCYRKAIERQPENYAAHVALAKALEADGKLAPAIDVLKKLQAQGPVAQPLALFELGDLYARWGLLGQAADTYEELAKLGFGSDSRLQLALGQAFARLGKKDRAREVLGKVPAYAPQYVTARQTCAAIEDKDEARLKILSDLRKAKPGQAGPLMQEMGILIEANRPTDAIKAYQEAVSGGKALPEQARLMALQAMFMAHDYSAAADLAARAANETHSVQWRHTAGLLAVDASPAAAKAFLSDVSKAGAGETLLGLIIASRTQGAVAPWKARLDEIQKDLAAMKPPQSLLPGEPLLAALAAGEKVEAGTPLADSKNFSPASRAAAAELIASAAQNPKFAAEACDLLKAALALNLGLQVPARDWSLKVLKTRPTCQWAAVMAAQTSRDAAQRQEVLQIIRPADCLVAQTLRAQVAMDEKQYDKAVAAWRTIVEANKGDVQSLISLGEALEKAGKPADALPLYRAAWDASQNPVAGNNASYLVTQLHAKDIVQLASAAKWMEATVKAMPNEAALRDTLGWIAHLQGRNDVALAELRRAVRGLPDSPDIHYHLGEAEAAAGSKDLARWHFAAAVSLAETLKARGGEVGEGTRQAAQLAKEALAKLDKSKS
jgi:predicted Zn-dependent protease